MPFDAVGNRLTEVTQAGTTPYVYDIANRLISVNGVTYVWDPRGNLISDGASTYTYDRANRMTTAVQGANNYAFAYNGLGDRLRQTVNGVPTNYRLDLEAGLTQVLSDGTNTYLYGLTRVGEKQPGGWQYHLGDALGSVRQLTGPTASVGLARSYQPFGTPLTSAGTASSIYQFTGEQRDGTGLTYLRARYMSTSTGRFLSRDTLAGFAGLPISENLWIYAAANPSNRIDPTGHTPFLPPQCAIPGTTAQDCVNAARRQYSKSGPILLAGMVWGGRMDCNNLEWSKPQDARDLLADFICERGPERVQFGGREPLTRELAETREMQTLRARFYREGNIPKAGESTEHRFNLLQLLGSLPDNLRGSGGPYNNAGDREFRLQCCRSSWNSRALGPGSIHCAKSH